MTLIDGWPDRETLYRCVKCGKWSHAQRKPSSHKRTLVDGLPAEHNGYDGSPARRVALASGYRAEDILEEVDPSETVGTVFNGHGDPEPDYRDVPGYVTVRCGPFETWEARRLVEDDRPLAVSTLGAIEREL